MNIQELRETVNPVFNTAKSCLYMNAAAGDVDSKHLMEVLGFAPTREENTNKNIPPEMLETVNRLIPVFMTYTESRFQSMNRLVMSMPERTVVDLPCGYTARGLKLSRQGRSYYGFDLPAVIDVIGSAAAKIHGGDQNIRYCSVDATNYESMEIPLAGEEKELAITTEGLLMYFNQNELEEVFSNIRRLLKKYGGSWIIVDRAYYMHDQSIAKAILGDDSGALAMYRAVQSQGSENASDVKTFDNAIFKGDDDEVKAFINRMGFAVREICMADFLPEQIVSLDGNQEADSAVRDVFKKMMFWELTVAENTVVKTADSNLPFKVASEVKNGVFDVSIQGRMDTITAPELLKQFQDAGNGFKGIHVDVSRMAYVSSAGLRVLLMMYKSLENKENFEMTGVSEAVREILETTGFDQFLL